MSKFDAHFEYDAYADDANSRQHHRSRKKHRSKPGRSALDADLRHMDDGIENWTPTYAQHLDPQHHERKWVTESLGHFYRQNIITDVTRLVKKGKEANVYACTAHPTIGYPQLAAKLYRPRMLRNLRNDAIYKAGRMLRDEEGDALRGRRERLALSKKSNFGQKLDFLQWIGTEFRSQADLYAAGADVPEPIGMQDNALLMAYIGDEMGPAPTLNEVRLPQDEALPLFHRLVQNIQLMLSMNLVHGDLSAYNILYWAGDIYLIDFPQMVNAYRNPHAFALFERDVVRVADYFSSFGLEIDAADIAGRLWEAYEAGELVAPETGGDQ